jgi:phosphatidyl-myo-inositol dimannoside synthase
MSGSKKALLICTGAYQTDGGIAAVNRLTIQAIVEEGISLDVFSLVEEKVEITSNHFSLEKLIRYQAFGGKKHLFILAVWRALFQNFYDFVIVDHVNLASILAPLVWLKRCKYIVWLCGIEVFSPRPDFQGKLGLRGASNCLAISDFTRQSVISRFPELMITVCDLALDPIRHSLPLELSQPARSGPPIVLQASDGSPLELGDQVILNVGRMTAGDRYKGQESLIRAFPLVYEKHPGAQLVLAGQGEDMPRLKNITSMLAPTVQRRIFFPGYVSVDMLDLLYRNCYIFAMPSIGEGFGLVYLEAMMRAKACLGARVDATPFVVRDGLTGRLVDNPKSPEQVADAVNWFLSHPEETNRMGSTGYDLVRSYYMFPHFQQRFWKAILA